MFVSPFVFDAKNMIESLVRYMKNGIKNSNNRLPIQFGEQIMMCNRYWNMLLNAKRNVTMDKVIDIF